MDDASQGVKTPADRRASLLRAALPLLRELDGAVPRNLVRLIEDEVRP